MPRLSKVTLKAMALTGNPANRRPIHAMKSAAAKEDPMPRAPARDDDEVLAEPSHEVLKALSEVQLEKAAEGDEEAHAHKEAIGRLLAVSKGLTFADVVNVAKAAGKLPEDVAKASADEEDDEDEEEEDDTMDSQDKKGRFKKGNPFAKDTKKSADVGYDDVLKSAPTSVMKAVEAMRRAHEAERAQDRERIAKAEKIANEERDYRLTGNIRQEIVSTFKNFAFSPDKLTALVKSTRADKNPQLAKDLWEVLSAADAQCGASAQNGGSAFGSVGKSSQFGAGTRAIDRINQAGEEMVKKSGGKLSLPQGVDQYLKTPEGMRDWAEHNQEGVL